MPRPTKPPAPSFHPEPAAQSNKIDGWTVEKIVVQLEEYLRDVNEEHALMTSHVLESAKVTDRRVQNGPDLFSSVRAGHSTKKDRTAVQINGWQHIKGRRDRQVNAHFKTIGTRTEKDRVPPYQFSHIGIKRNILTPNTMLTFTPHVRDLEGSEETKYSLWLEALKDNDLQSGFKPMNSDDKRRLVRQHERAGTISLYLDDWLQNMAIPGCKKPALIYMTARQQDDTGIADTRKSDPVQMFIDAFRQVFQTSQKPEKRIKLEQVLRINAASDNIRGSRSIANDWSSPQVDMSDKTKLIESYLATYCHQLCFICFRHSCDHGEYDSENTKRRFAMSSTGGLFMALKSRLDGNVDDLAEQTTSHHAPTNPCTSPWSYDDRILLCTIFKIASYSTYKGNPICLAAKFLNRHCDEVHREFISMGIALPQAESPGVARVKSLSWYERRRKVLLEDWRHHTLSHDHQRRNNLEPCSHQGPCLPELCTCVDADVLCESFCGCTANTCAHKFTGCSCPSEGKACLDNKRGTPCICVQLNRECDPQLCGSCGALARADALNANNADLHATGCQNCDLQRGLGKSLLLGKSRVRDAGYGLFAAENIRIGKFIIEYVGELITHDEGVRREARRGDTFFKSPRACYVFTLLDNEGIWIDAAKYGNLSRYINHASRPGTLGWNITPRILYVNGEYRIKFTALRNIKAGEELFFNYGENFTNLSEKRPNHKAKRKAENEAEPTKVREAEKSPVVASKSTTAEPRQFRSSHHPTGTANLNLQSCDFSGKSSQKGGKNKKHYSELETKRSKEQRRGLTAEVRHESMGSVRFNNTDSLGRTKKRRKELH